MQRKVMASGRQPFKVSRGFQSDTLHRIIFSLFISIVRGTAAWRNGIASDYESGDCRFDPCGGQSFFFSFLATSLSVEGLVSRKQSLGSRILLRDQLRSLCRQPEILYQDVRLNFVSNYIREW